MRFSHCIFCIPVAGGLFTKLWEISLIESDEERWKGRSEHTRILAVDASAFLATARRGLAECVEDAESSVVVP